MADTLMLVATVFAFATFVVFVAWCTRAAPLASAFEWVEDVADDVGPRTTSVHADARVVFCEPEFAGSFVTVDCALIAVDPPDTSAPQGTPFSMRLRAPETTLFRDLTMAVLADWAFDERVIDVEFSGDGRRAALDGGSARFSLILESISGLEPASM